ncbi:TBC1 domain family member 31, partial [Lingula anatina]|uniref:TBC1 domain family member 31 n=1 Tax=Lingula anatina TaxID=7574 RepID=A0A1S3KG72_LINAN
IVSSSSRDGRLLVAGGKSRFLHVWTLDTRRLLRIIQLPAKVKSVKEMEFLPDKFDAGSSQVLGVLSQDGIMRFIHIHTCKLLFDLGSVGDRINTMAMSPTGHHVVGVMEDGNLNIYSVQALTAELNKPPPPLVSVVSSQRKQETGDVTSLSQADLTQGKRASRLKRKARLAQGSDVSAVDVKPKKTSQEQVGLPEGLNMDKLMAILRGYGEYPAKYRMFLWRSILRLPENHAAYASLVDKGTHPAYENIHEKFPIKSRKLLRVLQRTLSALSHWSAIFGEMDYLPLLTFPFVKLFQNNQLVLFEIIATVLVNWCQHWFEFFPNPPINVLGMVENVLAFQDKELLQHFVKYGVTSQIYAWPVLETLFSEVLTKDEWLRLFDNVLSNHPAFLLMCVVAYCTACRGPLLQCIEFDDFKYFFHHRNAMDIGDVIKEAYRIQETTPPDVHPERMLDTFQPLTRGQYPVFNKYPKFIVDYQVQERERIREEELEYLRQRQVSLELQKETERRQQEEAAWYRQQELLLEAEEKRRKMISEEEEKLYEQRSRLQAMNREVKMKEMKLLDATRRKYMNYQQKQRTSEIKRLDDEIQRKAAMREMETQHAVQEAEIKNLELQLQKKMFEQELYREHAETTQKLRSEYDAFRKRQEIEDRGQHRVNLAEREREQEIRRRLQQNLAHAEHVTTDAETRKQMEYRQELDNLDREMQNVQLAKLQNENRDLEKEVHKLMNELKTRREGEAIETLEELQAQRRQADVAAERRTRLLREESGLAEDHLGQLGNTLDQSFERLRDLRQRATDNRDQSCLNEVSTGTDGTTTLSFDRTGRTSLDEGEAMLMQEVRRLREKLTSDSRTKKPPAEF